MSRMIQVNQDLSGRTFDVSTLPEGHARRSYLGQCNLQGTTVIGDIRGSDILRSQCEGLDVSQADTYGCLWTESTFDETSTLPDDAGAFQREITYERVRRYAANHLPARLRKKARDMLIAHKAGDFTTFCTLAQQVWSVARDKEEARKLWAAMPHHVREFIRDVFEGQCAGNALGAQRAVTVGWPDGITVTLDLDNLPPLPYPDDRVALETALLAPLPPTPAGCGYDRYLWVPSIRPVPRIIVLNNPDLWLTAPYTDY